MTTIETVNGLIEKKARTTESHVIGVGLIARGERLVSIR